MLLTQALAFSPLLEVRDGTHVRSRQGKLVESASTLMKSPYASSWWLPEHSSLEAWSQHLSSERIKIEGLSAFNHQARLAALDLSDLEAFGPLVDPAGGKP